MVSLNRTLAWRTSLFALLLIWPLVLFGRPTYLLGDSLSYLKVGQQAVEFANAKISAQFDRSAVGPSSDASSAQTAPSPSPGADTKTSRSVTYGVAAYVLRSPGQDMTALALAQVLAASLMCSIVTGVLGVKTRRGFVGVALVVAIATPLAAFAAFIVPDVWAGLLLGAITLLITGLDRLSFGTRLLLSGIISFAVTTHASIAPLAAGMTLVGAAVLFLGSRLGLSPVRHAWGWILIPPLLGFLSTTAISFVSFGKVSVTGKRIPTALARSVSDGPARWYLEQQCKVPRYAICEVFGTNIPKGVDELLFSKNSLRDLATAEQMDRIRAEERDIVVRAALAYPGVEIYNLSSAMKRQFLRFDLGLTNFKTRVALDKTGAPQLVATGRDHTATLHLFDYLTNLALAFSIGWAAWIFNRLESRERLTLLLLLIGVTGNVIICVVFSAVAERYQARVIWLLPLFILSIAAARFRDNETRAVG
jgi:hypothetical protein